jgi:hypothetical protein
VRSIGLIRGELFLGGEPMGLPDVLHIRGPGQEALMENDEVLDWIRRQATGARLVFSVCTGGDEQAQAIQLLMQYAPEPPFAAGTPKTAPAEVVAAARAEVG